MTSIQNPLISVVVPVYNAEQYLTGCLDSILDQTFTNFEVICVDDGSPDNSAEILNKYVQQDRRVKIIRQKNQGVSISRNNAIERACGEYIFFVDSDDYIVPQALEFLYRAITEQNADIACANFCYTSERYKRMEFVLQYQNISKRIFANPLYTYFTQRKIIYGMIWNKLYKSDMVKNTKFIPDRLFEDEIFTALIIEKCQKLIHVDFDVYYYFGNSESISRRKIDSDMLDDFMKNIEFLCMHFANTNEIRVIKERKIKALLSMSYKKIIALEDVNERKKLLSELKIKVKELSNKGLIGYGDFNIEGKLKLFRLLHLI